MRSDGAVHSLTTLRVLDRRCALQHRESSRAIGLLTAPPLRPPDTVPRKTNKLVHKGTEEECKKASVHHSLLKLPKHCAS